MRASWAAAVTEGLNSLGVMGPAHTLVRDGAGGFGFAPLPANNRFRTGIKLIEPFTFRYVEESDDDDVSERTPYTGWEIYMPRGCVSIFSTCEPINPKAYRETDDGKKELDGWYRMPEPAGEKSDQTDWSVVVHAKCCAGLTGIDSLNDRPKKYAWAEIRDEAMTQEERDEDVNDVGDTFSAVVGSVSFRENEETGDLEPVCTHSIRTPILLREDSSAEPFSLLTYFSVDDDEVSLSLDRLFIRNASFSTAGATYIATDMTEIELDDEAVYLKISAMTNPYTASLKTYKTIRTGKGKDLTVTEQAKADSVNGEMLYLIYQLKNGHVIGKTLNSISNISLYQ